MLGPITYTRDLVQNTPWPEIFRVENKGKALAITENWHTDGITSPRPPSFTILAAQVLPEAGGDTFTAAPSRPGVFAASGGGSPRTGFVA